MNKKVTVVSKRLLCMLLSMTLLLSCAVPALAAGTDDASQDTATSTQTGSGISALSEDVEYVSLPVTIRDFAADGMLFECNQVDVNSGYAVWKEYAFQEGSLSSDYNWGDNDNLGFRIRTYKDHGADLPSAYDYWYCVICDSKGNIKKILPSGFDSKTEYATYMTSGCFSVWLWATSGSSGVSEAELAQRTVYNEFVALVNEKTQHRYQIRYDNGYLTVEVPYLENKKGEKFIISNNNGFTLLKSNESSYIHNLATDESISDTQTISIEASDNASPQEVTLTSGAIQHVYSGNLRMDLLENELDGDKKPVYTQATVDYLAQLLKDMLAVPYTEKLYDGEYYTGYYILGQKLYDENFDYAKGDDSKEKYDLADVFRSCINGGMGTYSNAKARFEKGELSVPKNINTYYEAAYYLLHSLWRDNATEGHSGNDGYGWNTWNYNKIHLIQTTNDAGEKCYVFNSGYDNTKYDPLMEAGSGYTGSGAIYNTQLEKMTAAKDPNSNKEVISGGLLLPAARFDPLGKSGSGYSFGYGVDDGTYCKLMGSYPDRGETYYPETNYHTSLEGHAKFIYYAEANQYFTFTGDDDVYLYINGKRVLDLGGAHAIAKVSINLNEVAQLCGLSDGMTYDFDFYFLERHGTAANFGIETNIQIVDPSMLTTKTGYQNGVATGYNGYVNPDMPVVYEFGLENDGESAIKELTFSDPKLGVTLTKDTVTLNSLTKIEDLSVTLYGDDGQVTTSVPAGSLTEDVLKQYLADGLQVGEKLVIYGFAYKISAEDWECRFNDNNGNGVYDDGDTPASNWYFFNVAYTTAVAVGDNNSTKELSGTTNWVVQKQLAENAGSLAVTKELDKDASHTLMDQLFTVQVLLDGKQLPVGTEYTVGSETRTVVTAGQIVVGVGETAVLQGIAAGTQFQVRELITEENRDIYRATYEAESAEVSADGVSGTITASAKAEVTVINHTVPGSLVSTNKYVTAGETANQFTLTLESFVKGQLTDVATTTPADFVLVLDQSASMYAPAGVANGYDNSEVIGDLSSSVAVTDLDTDKAQYMGYYIAQSTSGRGAKDDNGNDTIYYDWFVVQYIEGKWYYVRKDKTAMPATLDKSYSGNTNAIGATLAQDTPIEHFNYYQSGYGALYDAVTGFVKDLKETGVDHRVAVVGFASPCYDAMEYFDGSGVYVNGEYYLYDAEYLIDENGKYYTYKFGDDTKTKIELSDAEAAALNKNAAADVYNKALVSVENGYDSIKASLNAVTTNYWHTCPAAGLDMANQIFAATPANGRNRTVLLFTDGEPTVSLGGNFLNSEDWSELDNGLYVSHTYWTVAAGKNSAIEQASITKNNYGANIHTIGTAGAEADELFLAAVSSDYPNATYYPTTFINEEGKLKSFEDDPEAPKPTDEEIKAGMGDPIAEPMFSHLATEDLSLDAIFEEILRTTTTLDLGADAVLKEVLTDYFDLESGTLEDVHVYTAPYDGKGNFGEKTELADAKVTLSSSDGSGRMDTVEVTGYDYAAEYVAEESRGENYYGSKLIVEVKIKTREGFWGGNNVPTNEDTTAIYEKSGELVDKFPEPQVNVPLSLTLQSEDAVVYYGSDVLSGGLLTKLTAGGMNVVVNADGTLAPQADWMDDFATLTWTGGVGPNEALSTTQAGQYTYAAKLVPNTDGSSNTATYPSNMAGEPVSVSGLTAQDISQVEILVPVIPFQDSTIYKGEATPDKAYFDRVNLVDGSIKWVLMNDTGTTKAATHGTAPALTFTYDPHTTDGAYVEATAVDVTVSAQYGTAAAMDFTGVSYFSWYTCTNDTLHDEGAIAQHLGTTENQNEFWIHISDKEPNGDLNTSKSVTATEDPNEFVLTLEAYATGQVEQITFTKPADIVLVLDHSGSMRTPAGASKVLWSADSETGRTGEPYDGKEATIPIAQMNEELGSHRGYYVAWSTSSNSWFVMEYDKDGYWYSYKVPSTEAIVDTGTDANGKPNWTEHTLTQRDKLESSTYENLIYYKSQYAVLYDALLAFVGDLKASGAEHNVAIVGFAGSEGAGTRLYVGSAGENDSGVKTYRNALYHENTTQARRDELYQLAMKNVQDTGEYAELLSNIELIDTNYSYTCPTAGLQLANEVFAANAVNLAERDRIVVLFTDGIPNRLMGEDKDVDRDDAEKQTAIYDEIVRKAYETKTTYSAQVYTICTTTLTGEKTFLNYASSDYPDATGYATPGTKASEQYFHETNDFVTLQNVFTQVHQSTTKANVTLDETAALKEVLTDYFALKSDDEVDVTVYIAPYDGEGNFGEKTELTDAKVTLSSSDGSDRLDTVEVTGFDYAAHYVSDVARTVNGENYYGSKLIVEVRVKTREGFWGGNNVPTNEETTGIYTDDGTMVESFPEPEVNVPIDVDVVAKDKTIYYQGEVAAKDLLEKVTVGGVDVEIQDDGTLTPKEDWMDDYANLSWTDTSTKPGDPADDQKPADYTFQVQAEPKYDGSKNRQENPGNLAGNIDGGEVEESSAETTKTAEDTGHVYILVPQLTFRDSVTDFATPAEGYPYETKDYVAEEILWVDMENGLKPGDTVPNTQKIIPALDTGVEEPALERSYTPDDEALHAGTFVTDTKVDVAVTMNGEDITDIVKFAWNNDCTFADHTDSMNIAGHSGNEESHEFWVHVELKLVPDTVVIDYGLDVVIDVLSNDPRTESIVPTLTGIGLKGADTFGTVEVAYTDGFGTLKLEEDATGVRYVLNKKNGMQIHKEEVFTYQATYTINGQEKNLSADVTVIPATTIYYEDSFVEFSVWDADDAALNTAAENQWTDEGTALNYDQEQDRPGAAGTDENNTPASIDADKIYGYDGAYTDMTTYSLGSSKKVTVNEELFAEAQFTFYGTGFDVISLTSNTTGTILVDVYKASDFKTSSYAAPIVKSTMVDAYYGYKYVLCNVTYEWDVTSEHPDGHWVLIDATEAAANATEQPVSFPETAQDGDTARGVEYTWIVDASAEDSLYQVPVMKVNGLNYDQYTAVITVVYKPSLDHQNHGSYDFYLDAIRIYDPANDGATSETVKDAYVADKEGWPEYFELRNLIISKEDFNSLEDGTGKGIIFIDNTLDKDYKTTYTIADYTNYGPNNELYLAPGQSAAFQLAVPDNVAAVHLAMKSVGGTETVKATVCDAEETSHSLIPAEISTATDLYYDITDLNNKTVVITNTGETGGAILSITNVKVTYTTAYVDSLEQSYFTVSKADADAALAAVMLLTAPAVPDEEIPEPTEPEIETPASDSTGNDAAEEQTPAPEKPDGAGEQQQPEQEQTDPTEPARPEAPTQLPETPAQDSKPSADGAQTGDENGQTDPEVKLWPVILALSGVAALIVAAVVLLIVKNHKNGKQVRS